MSWRTSLKKPFLSKYESTCAICGKTIYKGISYIIHNKLEGWVHKDCDIEIKAEIIDHRPKIKLSTYSECLLSAISTGQLTD